MDPLWLSTRQQNFTQYSYGTALSGSSSELATTAIDDYSIHELEILDPTGRTCLVVLYSATSVLAFVGNLLVIIVEIFGRRSAPSLRKFLINLAISDILFGVFSVPFTYTDFMYGRWIFFPWLCPWAQFIQILSIFITSFTLTFISIERFYAIKFPLSNQNKWLTTRSQYILIIGWLLGIVWASVPNTQIVQFEWKNQLFLDCRPDQKLYENQWYNIGNLMLTFGCPLMIQSISYASIIRCLLCKDSNLQSSQPMVRQNRDMARIIRMLVAVVILFVICWLPIRILMTVITYSPDWLFINDPQSNNIYVASYFLCHWMAMANSFVNPIIYSFMSKSFRIDLQELIAKICRKSKPGVSTWTATCRRYELKQSSRAPTTGTLSSNNSRPSLRSMMSCTNGEDTADENEPQRSSIHDIPKKKSVIISTTTAAK